MTSLYLDGKKIGELADLEKLLPELQRQGHNVEMRDENGRAAGKITFVRILDPDEPLVPWEPDITREELDRRAAEPGYTFEEVKKRLGWE